MATVTHNILVIRRRYLGDIVLLASFFRNLRLHWPAARITALVETPYAEVLTLNPDVDAILPLPTSRAGLPPWLKILRRLRAARFTHVFDLDNVRKTALLTRLIGAPFRAALLHEQPGHLPGLYTHIVIDPPQEHESQPITEYYLRLLSAAGVPVVTREVRLVPSEADLAAARELVRAKIGNQQRKILLHPGSRSAFRLWPAENFAAVCDRAQVELGAKILLAGGPGEQNLISDIRRHAKTGLASIDGPLSIRQFAALAAQFDTMLCHDSGPMHLAAAVGTPVIALFGSQNAAVWRPLGSRHILLQPPLPCRACVAPGSCVPGDSYRNYCVQNITVDTALSALRSQFTSPSQPITVSHPQPLITFAFPAYNRPQFLAEALASLASQEGDFDFDVIVCDDGGLAETRRAVENFSARPIALHVNPSRLGPVANWNRCLQLARGRWVMVLHEDDLLYPWYLRIVVPHLRDGLAAICTQTVQGPVPPALVSPPRQPVARVYPPHYFLKSSMTPFPGVLMRGKLAQQLGGFDEHSGPLADYEFWYRLACVGRVDIVHATGAFYRVAPGQWTENEWSRMLRQTHLLRLRIAREQFPGKPQLGRWLARFFTYRNAKSYARRFAERPDSLQRTLELGRIPLAGLPSGWIWLMLKLSA